MRVANKQSKYTTNWILIIVVAEEQHDIHSHSHMEFSLGREAVHEEAEPEP